MKRRTFIKTGTGIVAAGLLAPGLGCSKKGATKNKLDKIGVQLYSIRSKMAEDFEGSLAKVAHIGYNQVEFAGYYDRTPQQVASLMKDFGLEAPSTHVGLAILQNEMDKALEYAAALGHKYIICPWVDKSQYPTLDDWKKLAATLNAAAETCKTSGFKFAYHNHDFEFTAIEGALPMDIILNETDPALVNIELDLFWIKKAGHSALDYFKKYPGRFKLCHVKDMTAAGEMADVGAGQMDFAAIFAQAPAAGLEYFIVEHDNPTDPFASIEASYQYLKGLEF